MYLPKHFEETRTEVLHACMAANPLATLVTVQDGVPCADEIPCVRVCGADGADVLRAHVARANPVWRHADGQPVLVVFRGAQAYVSPGWYPSKASNPKVVPTWNYVMVQARGVLRVVDDDAWLTPLLRQLTDTHEARQRHPWSVDDAPADYLAAMRRAVVGLEIRVTQLHGKFKLSQNRSATDKAGVVQGLHEQADAGAQALAQAMQHTLLL